VINHGGRCCYTVWAGAASAGGRYGFAPGSGISSVYNAGEIPESVMVHFARNFVVDLANDIPASAESGYLSTARYMTPELPSRFEPIARAQL